jgi:hypothetical protein
MGLGYHGPFCFFFLLLCEKWAWLFGWFLIVHGPLGYNTYPATSYVQTATINLDL